MKWYFSINQDLPELTTLSQQFDSDLTLPNVDWLQLSMLPLGTTSTVPWTLLVTLLFIVCSWFAAGGAVWCDGKVATPFWYAVFTLYGYKLLVSYLSAGYTDPVPVKAPAPVDCCWLILKPGGGGGGGAAAAWPMVVPYIPLGWKPCPFCKLVCAACPWGIPKPGGGDTWGFPFGMYWWVGGHANGNWVLKLNTSENKSQILLASFITQILQAFYMHSQVYDYLHMYDIPLNVKSANTFAINLSNRWVHYFFHRSMYSFKKFQLKIKMNNLLDTNF